MYKKMEALFIALAATYIGTGGLLYALQERFIFPQEVNQIEPEPLQPHVQNLEMPDGTTLNGVVFESTAENAPLILAFGGNAHDVTGFAHFLYNDVYQNSAHVIGFSYRGYPNANGQSEGAPTQKNIFADALFLYDHFTEKFQPTTVIPIGYSLGSSVATYVSTQRPVQHTVLAAPFASIRTIAQQQYWMFPVSLLLKHPFETERMIQSVQTPVLILAAENDGIVPPNHAQKVANAAPNATLHTLPNTNHGNILWDDAVPTLLRPLIE